MIISVTSLKGGVGKSTIAQNLAVMYAHAGRTVSIIDADTNQSSIKWSSLRDPNLPPVPVYGLPDGNALVPNVKALSQVNDLVIIDGTPSLSKLTSRIILVADFVLIPMLPAAFDLWATADKFMDHYWSACEQKNTKIPAAFVLNRYKKTKVAGDVAEILETTDVPLMNTKLNDRIVYNNAVYTGNGIYEMKDEKTKMETIRFFNELNEKL